MKFKIIIIFLLLICMTTYVEAIPFNSTWNTASVSSGSSNSTTIVLPIESGGTYDFTVNWGDGNSSQVIAYGQSTANHTYTTEGIYDLSINGTITGFRFANTGDKLKITDISQWGDLNLGNNGSYFYGCSNLNVSATDMLNLTGTTTMTYMFRYTSVFNGNISAWDTSNVTNMYSMFSYASIFNSNISAWDTSSVTSMAYMFRYASAFNGNISAWDTSNVISMGSMFSYASAFNGNISAWDTSSVTSMSSMFYHASAFNQDLGGWNVSNNLNYLNFLYGVTLSATNYNSLLNGWAALPVLSMNESFHGGNSQYTSATRSARNDTLIDVWNWTITDGGQLYINVYIFNSNTGSYDNVSTRTVQPNQGLLIYSDADVTWERTL